MMKELISYNDSLMLRELGFDEACFAWYSKGQLILEHHIIFTGDQYYMRKEDCNAPTFSQAFRFFREKYNIQGYIYSSAVRGNAEKTKQFTGYIWNINGIDMPFISTDARDKLHDTYEEAELACLMKLIEIKNKSV